MTSTWIGAAILSGPAVPREPANNHTAALASDSAARTALVCSTTTAENTSPAEVPP